MIKNAPTVLLVEDDCDDEALTTRSLRRAHLNSPVEVAHDGQEAIDYLFGTEEQPAKPVPALVLLDLKLPRLSGLEILKRIRADEHTRRVPVVILTSSSGNADLINGYDLGANSYVCKPIQFDEFANVVKQLGVYWLMINEPAPRSATAPEQTKPTTPSPQDTNLDRRTDGLSRDIARHQPTTSPQPSTADLSEIRQRRAHGPKSPSTASLDSHARRLT